VEGSSRAKTQLDSFSRFENSDLVVTDRQTDTGPWLVPALA